MKKSISFNRECKNGSSIQCIIKSYVEDTFLESFTIDDIKLVLRTRKIITSDSYIYSILNELVEYKLLSRDGRRRNKKIIYYVHNNWTRKKTPKKPTPKVEISVESSIIDSISKLKRTIKNQEMIIKSHSHIEKKLYEKRLLISNLLKTIEDKDILLDKVKRMLNIAN